MTEPDAVPPPGRARTAFLRWSPELLVLLGFVAYVVAWSSISVTRYATHHAYVYDLGAEFESFWLVVHGHQTLPFAVSSFLDNGLPYMAVPLLGGGYTALLVAQTVAIGACVFPIYGIASHQLKDEPAALMLALSFLVFFPASGANWYDFHSELFFAVIFLTAYFVFLKGFWKLSFALFLVSGLVRFPFIGFPLLFGLVVSFDAFVLRRDFDAMPLRVARRFGPLLTLSCLAILAVTLLWALPSIYGQNQLAALLLFSSASGIVGPPVDYWDKLLTLVLVLAPLLLAPLFSRRWVIFLAPYAILLYFTNFWAYSYPYAFQYQYIFSLVPFLYLGTIDALAHGFPWSEISPRDRPRPARRWRWRRSVTQRRVAGTILTLVVIAALFLEPYGPFNAGTFDSFDYAQQLTENSTFVAEFQHLAALIPASTPFVLVQDNMPELYPRPLAAHTVLTPGVSTFAPITVQDAVNGSFPVRQNGALISVPFDYAIADIGSATYLYGTPSMNDFVHTMYGSGAYGILGEASGMIVLERGYDGGLQYFVPYQRSIPVSSLFSWPASAPLSGGTVSYSNTSGNVPLWLGPYALLLPGQYVLSLSLRTTNLSASNSALVQVLTGPSAQLVTTSVLTGAAFGSVDQWTSVSVPFYANSTLNDTQFIVRSLDWNGTLEFRGGTLVQSGVPATTFRVGISARDDLFYQLLRLIPNGSSVVLQPPFVGGTPQLTVLPSNQPVAPSGAGFIVADPFSPGFDCAPSSCPGLPTMRAVVNSALQNATFGILGEEAGMLLLERGYTGPVAYYSPLVQAIYPGALFEWPSGNPLQNATLSATNTSGDTPLWLGPYSYLVPGHFVVRFALSSSDTNPANEARVQALAGTTAGTILAQENLSGSNFTTPGTWVTVALGVEVTLTYSFTQYLIRSLSWTGTLSLNDIELQEVAPP